MRYLNVRVEVVVEIDDDFEAAIEDGNWDANDLLESISETLHRGHFTEITEAQAQKLENK